MKPHRNLVRHYPALLLVLALTSNALAQRNENLRSSPKMKAAFREVVAKPSQSVMRILVDDKDAALGTVVGADGWILTKASLLKSEKIAVKLKDGKKLDARIVGVHDAHDLAML